MSASQLNSGKKYLQSYDQKRFGFTHFPGMVAREFKGIPSLQEVECWGYGLKPDVKLMSLKLYAESENNVLASLNVFTNTCLTYTAYSSCFVDDSGGHRSTVKVLVSDLREGESRTFGCKLTVLESEGDAADLKRTFVVTRRSKYKSHSLLLLCYVETEFSPGLSTQLCASAYPDSCQFLRFPAHRFPFLSLSCF